MSPQGGLFEARRSLVAGLGVGGIAVALASRSTVETLFGGVSIFADRPFRVGDSIRFQAAHGIVGSIGPRSTRIRGPHGTLTTAPNAGIAKAHVTNLSMRSRFLFDHRVVLPPATGEAEVARVLAALLVGHPVVVKGGRIPWARPARHPRLPRAPSPALYGRVNTALPFWRAKTLDAMTRAEWESLCDGCGRCCLHKLRDDDTDRIAFTNIACRLLDADTCRCKDYANRKRRVPDCVKLTPARIAAIDWLPPTCAYRLVGEGQDLPWWHPLVSGRAETVHEAGVSVRGRVVAEREAGDFEDHIVTWPGRSPARARTHGKTRKAG